MESVTLLAVALRVWPRAGFAISLAVLCIYASASRVEAHKHPKGCPTGFAAYGGSFMDTGNIVNAFPYGTNFDNPPYGEDYFGKPSKRACNGRIVADYVSLAFHYPLLDPYFKASTYSYKYGINFAESDGAAVPRLNARNPYSFIPWQLRQFIRFVASVTESQANPDDCGPYLDLLPSGSSYLSDWLFTIGVGTNDILLNSDISTANGTQVAINTTVPQVVGGIALGIQTLYAMGARKFLVFGILPPECGGCREAILSPFTAEILGAIGGLRASLNGSTIAYYDYYAAFKEIISNAASYGFTYLPPKICCGSYNLTVPTCGTGVPPCPNPEQYVYWDGIHFTTAFYRVIAKFVLEGKFTDGGASYADLCNLDFSEFGPKATYKRNYPAACDSSVYA